MEYKIVKKQFPDELADAVNEAIRDGWKPLGGPTVKHFWNNAIQVLKSEFCQAMIKE